MPKKQALKGDLKTQKVQVRLPGRLVAKVDRKARSAGVSRAALLRQALEREVGEAPTRRKSYEELVSEADALKAQAEKQSAAGLGLQSASTCLLAAAKEIEAAAALCPSEMPSDEAKMKSVLVIALQLIKRGSGYRQLPETPASRTASGSVQ